MIYTVIISKTVARKRFFHCLFKKEVLLLLQLEAVQGLLNEVKTKETPEPKDPGLVTMEDVTPFITPEQKEQYQLKFEVRYLCEKLQVIEQ